jgi:hypothetical protein
VTGHFVSKPSKTINAPLSATRMPSIFFPFLIDLTGRNPSNKNVRHPVFEQTGTVIERDRIEKKSLRIKPILGIFAKIFQGEIYDSHSK